MNFGVKKISDNISTYHIMDHYFWALIMYYIASVPNLKGAIDAQNWSVAAVTMKELLYRAIAIFLYINGYKVNDNDKYYMFLRLKEALSDDRDLYDEILNIEYTNMFEIDELNNYISNALETIERLVPEHYVKYLYENNYIDFEKALEIYVKIDELEKKFMPYQKFSFPPEINEQILMISKKVNHEIE